MRLGGDGAQRSLASGLCERIHKPIGLGGRDEEGLVDGAHQHARAGVASGKDLRRRALAKLGMGHGAAGPPETRRQGHACKLGCDGLDRINLVQRDLLETQPPPQVEALAIEPKTSRPQPVEAVDHQARHRQADQGQENPQDDPGCDRGDVHSAQTESHGRAEDDQENRSRSEYLARGGLNSMCGGSEVLA